MDTDGLETQTLDYLHCSYGASRIDFRGPPRPLDVPYVSVIGGSETYGKFVAEPFPDLLERMIGEPVLNLGCMHAGLTVFCDDPEVSRIAGRGRMAVIQILGAQNMSNRFYSVHPRRNDRFLGASLRMQSHFPDVDFTEFNFTGHLLQSLSRTSPDGFRKLSAELREAWVCRMQQLISSVGGDVLLLWLAHRRPEEPWNISDSFDPLFVDRDMLEALSPGIAGIVEVTPPASERKQALAGKTFAPWERRSATAMPGPAFHSCVANALAATLAPDTLKKKRRTPPERDAPSVVKPVKLRASR